MRVPDRVARSSRAMTVKVGAEPVHPIGLADILARLFARRLPGLK